jgi:DNA-binding NarL/FixJ family response regulator
MYVHIFRNGTVKNHLSNVLFTLFLRGRTQIALYTTLNKLL